MELNGIETCYRYVTMKGDITADGEKPVLEKYSSSKEHSNSISGDRRTYMSRSSMLTLYLPTSSLGGVPYILQVMI